MTLESLRHIVKATIKAMNNMQDKVIIATRESPLALWQANFIAQQLRSFYPNLTVDLLGMTTEGDRILDKTLSKIGGKGLFVKELEQALLEGKADLAVHSIKDVPMTLPESFTLALLVMPIVVQETTGKRTLQLLSISDETTNYTFRGCSWLRFQ